jgi:hypothetical protein
VRDDADWIAFGHERIATIPAGERQRRPDLIRTACPHGSRGPRARKRNWNRQVPEEFNSELLLEGEDVSKWMARSGWALSFVRYSHAYDADEVVAREAHAGLWSGAFIAPWDWRHRNKTTIILGAATVPVNAQTILLGAVSASEAPSAECVIKGNVNRKGERIYHLPGQLNYAQINMTKGLGERWFCTEAEADAAGWRKAVR